MLEHAGMALPMQIAEESNIPTNGYQQVFAVAAS
jgi:hypothetical protein